MLIKGVINCSEESHLFEKKFWNRVYAYEAAPLSKSLFCFGKIECNVSCRCDRDGCHADLSCHCCDLPFQQRMPLVVVSVLCNLNFFLLSCFPSARLILLRHQIYASDKCQRLARSLVQHLLKLMDELVTLWGFTDDRCS